RPRLRRRGRPRPRALAPLDAGGDRRPVGRKPAQGERRPAPLRASGSRHQGGRTPRPPPAGRSRSDRTSLIARPETSSRVGGRRDRGPMPSASGLRRRAKPARQTCRRCYPNAAYLWRACESSPRYASEPRRVPDRLIIRVPCGTRPPSPCQMATASRSRQPAGARPNRTPNLTAVVALDAVRTWAIPSVATAVIVGGAVLSALGVVPTAGAVAAAILAALVLLAYISLRPLLAPEVPAQARLIGLGVALVFVLVCYVPFHVRLFP